MNSCCSVSSFKVLKRGQIEHELEEKENPESIHSWHPPYVRCLLRVWCIASYFVRPCFRDAGGGQVHDALTEKLEEHRGTKKT